MQAGSSEARYGTGAIGASVEIHNLRKAFGPVLAVESFTLDVRAGEFLSILGASGSGKSTVLRMIAGLEEPTSGRMLIDGRDATNLLPESRDIGMVFQDYALFPHMTVWQNISFPLRMRRMATEAIQEKVARVMDLVGIAGLSERKPTQVSGGQQQRVALARALVFDPKLLLLDEPLSALDKNLRDYMKAEIKSLHRRVGVTVVYVTHDQSEALALSDRVVVMRQGRIVDVDTPERLYRLPSTRYIAGFIGEANLIEGHIDAVGNGNVDVRCAFGNWAAPSSQVRLTGDIAVKRPVTIVFRPEDVLIGPPNGKACRDLLVVDCKIAELLYNGSHTVFDLRPIGMESSLNAHSQLAHNSKVQAGSIVRVGLSTARAVVVDRQD